MAAFDIRHLSAPLASKLNLVTIIFVVTLFSVYRLSMGAVNSQPIPQKKVVVQPEADVIAAPVVQPKVEKKVEAAAPADTNAKPEDFLKQLLENPAPAHQPEVVQEQEAPLDDVEKALGIAH